MFRNPSAEKWKLATEVRDLAIRLDRPVCSADLRAHFREYPDRYPLFMQRLGQVMIKAARRTKIQAIWPVGKIHSAVFYAPDLAPEWGEKLESYRLKNEVVARLTEDFPGFVSPLLGGEHDKFARNSFAGYVAEWSPVAESPLLQSWLPLKHFKQLIETAKKSSADSFVAISPIDLVDRIAAGNILRREYRRRIDPVSKLSLHRHLARLSWPQCSLMPSCGTQKFSRAQVFAYAVAAWANDVAEWDLNQAMVRALRYGIGPAAHRSRKTLEP